MFVVVSEFIVPGQSPQRLMALQRITGDLDAVELKAWQDMVHVLTHEMMNSLTPISSLSESLESLLRSSGGSTSPAMADEVAGALEAIKRRSLGLMGFVDRYRTVAELPAPKRQEVSMERLLSGIDRLLGPALQEKGVDYRTSITPAGAVYRCGSAVAGAGDDQSRCGTRRMPWSSADRPRIDVTCEQRDGQVVLAVADNGAGVPEDRRDQIFVPFFTTKAGGSGHRAQSGAAHRAGAWRAARAASQLAAGSGVRFDVEQESGLAVSNQYPIVIWLFRYFGFSSSLTTASAKSSALIWLLP